MNQVLSGPPLDELLQQLKGQLGEAGADHPAKELLDKVGQLLGKLEALMADAGQWDQEAADTQKATTPSAVFVKGITLCPVEETELCRPADQPNLAV